MVNELLTLFCVCVRINHKKYENLGVAKQTSTNLSCFGIKSFNPLTPIQF